LRKAALADSIFPYGTIAFIRPSSANGVLVELYQEA
jgi:hypothetical protein